MIPASPPPAVYVVVNKHTRERGAFTQAHDVALYMWGRDFSQYQIYKNGAHIPWLDGDLTTFERELEAA